MARRDGPVIINIIEIPAGTLVEVIGKGLKEDDTGKKFDVALGSGLKFDNNDIVVDTGNSLNIVNNKLEVNVNNLVGDSLTVANNKIVVKTGKGLDEELNVNPGKGIEVDAKVNVRLGAGLSFVDNAITFDASAVPGMTLSFTSLVDIFLTVDGNELTVKKTFSRYDLERNDSGIVVGISDGYRHDVFQTISLPTTYGGYTMTTRTGTISKPNFYKK